MRSKIKSQVLGVCREFMNCVNESTGGRPGLPVPNSPCGLCGRNLLRYTWCVYLAF